MIATLPPYKPREPIGIVNASIAIALLLSPFAAKLYLEHRERMTIAGEFQSERSAIFSRIDGAVERQDLDALDRIRKKYVGCVTDEAFLTTIRRAFAQVAAREAALELAVSRHLDLLRHQEEATIDLEPFKPRTVSKKPTKEQSLSKLPR